ncbi:MAG: cyclase family protein [Gemmobacter sp.]
MCHHCIIDRVRDSMLSRRSFFQFGAGAAAAATVAAAPAPARAQGPRQVHDLTHLLTEDFPTFFGDQWAFRSKVFDIDTQGLYGNEWTLNEHVGTHIDAPAHFSKDGLQVHQIPVEKLVAPLCVVDIREKVAADPDATLTPDDLRAWIAAHGPIPDGACIAMLSGWDAHVRTPKFRNADDKGVMHFPGFHGETAQMMLEETTAVGLAVDTLSQDPGGSTDIPVHLTWLPANRWGLECVANLAALPATGATIIAAAPKLDGGSGGSTRVLALV